MENLYGNHRRDNSTGQQRFRQSLGNAAAVKKRNHESGGEIAFTAVKNAYATTESGG